LNGSENIQGSDSFYVEEEVVNHLCAHVNAIVQGTKIKHFNVELKISRITGEVKESTNIDRDILLPRSVVSITKINRTLIETDGHKSDLQITIDTDFRGSKIEREYLIPESWRNFKK